MKKVVLLTNIPGNESSLFIEAEGGSNIEIREQATKIALEVYKLSVVSATFAIYENIDLAISDYNTYFGKKIVNSDLINIVNIDVRESPGLYFYKKAKQEYVWVGFRNPVTKACFFLEVSAGNKVEITQNAKNAFKTVWETDTNDSYEFIVTDDLKSCQKHFACPRVATQCFWRQSFWSAEENGSGIYANKSNILDCKERIAIRNKDYDYAERDAVWYGVINNESKYYELYIMELPKGMSNDIIQLAFLNYYGLSITHYYLFSQNSLKEMCAGFNVEPGNLYHGKAVINKAVGYFAFLEDYEEMQKGKPVVATDAPVEGAAALPPTDSKSNDMVDTLPSASAPEVHNAPKELAVEVEAVEAVETVPAADTLKEKNKSDDKTIWYLFECWNSNKLCGNKFLFALEQLNINAIQATETAGKIWKFKIDKDIFVSKIWLYTSKQELIVAWSAGVFFQQAPLNDTITRYIADLNFQATLENSSLVESLVEKNKSDKPLCQICKEIITIGYVIHGDLRSLSFDNEGYPNGTQHFAANLSNCSYPITSIKKLPWSQICEPCFVTQLNANMTLKSGLKEYKFEDFLQLPADTKAIELKNMIGNYTQSLLKVTAGNDFVGLKAALQKLLPPSAETYGEFENKLKLLEAQSLEIAKNKLEIEAKLEKQIKSLDEYLANQEVLKKENENLKALSKGKSDELALLVKSKQELAAKYELKHLSDEKSLKEYSIESKRLSALVLEGKKQLESGILKCTKCNAASPLNQSNMDNGTYLCRGCK